MTKDEHTLIVKVYGTEEQVEKVMREILKESKKVAPDAELTLTRESKN